MYIYVCVYIYVYTHTHTHTHTHTYAGKPFNIDLSFEFDPPTKGRLKFLYNAYSSSLVSAHNRVYQALLELFRTETFNVRRDVLMQMVVKGAVTAC